MKFKIQPVKKAAVGLFIVLMLFATGCYDSIEVDEMVYVVAMGLDNGTNGNLRMSLLLAVPIAVGVGPEPGEVDKSTTLITVEAPTIYGGINIANSMLSKQVNLSHAKLIVIAKELAEKGVDKYMNTFARFREFRPETYIGISRGLAEEFLKESKPVLEINPAKYYELLMETWQYTGFSVGSNLNHFYSEMESNSGEAVAALLDINQLEDTKEFEQILSTEYSGDTEQIMEGDYKAGEVPAIFDNKSMNMGIAVFKADKMVGEMDGRETVYYLMVTGKLRDSYFTIPDPQEQTSTKGDPARTEDGTYVSLRLSLARKPVIQVRMKEDNPKITVHLLLEGSILSAESDRDYSTGEGMKELEKFAGEYIRQDILSFLEKTRDQYKSDICGIGKRYKMTFLRWDEWIRFRWLEKYEKAEFDVVTKVSIRRSGMTIKQIPMSELKGGEQ